MVYPVRLSRLPGVLAFVTWLVGLGLLLYWTRALVWTDWRARLGAAAAIGAGAGLLWEIQRDATGVLYWDGAVWRWTAGYPGSAREARSLTLVADFQRLLIIQLTLDNRRRVWLWAMQSARPERWMDFRRAVHLPGKHAQAPISTGTVPAETLTPVAALDIPVEPVENLTRSNQ